MAAFEYIKESDLLTTYEDAKKKATPLHEPFEEWERLARNKPHPGIDKNLPRVTDGTLASLIQEQPKRIIQQIPTGEVEANNPWLDIMATHLLTKEILPNANQDGALIQKSWALISKALIYGSQPTMVQFLNRGDYFGTDFTLPYVKDVLLEPGKLSDRASNVIMLRTWWAKNQIEAIIHKEKTLGDRAKERGDEYETGWDLAFLADLISVKASQKDVNAQTPSEKNKLLNAGFYELGHAFQRGKDAIFYTFSPRHPSGENVARRRKNKDPRGDLPIHYMYNNLNFDNPLGRGAVEMSGGVQNLLDSEMQMYQYNRALMLNPPMIKRGSWSKSQAKYVPNHVIDLGNDSNASFEPIKIDSSAIANFSNNYSLLKSQIQNGLGGGIGNDISGSTGDTQSSKTPQGVKANEARLSTSDNYLRRQFEGVFQDICETMINLYFAERSGTQELTVDQETADKLKEVDPQYVSPDNVVRINYDSETPKLKFKVDATSSEVKDNTEQIESLRELIKETSENPLIPYYLDQAGFKMDLGQAYKEEFERFGVKNLNKIIVELPPEEKGKMPYPKQEEHKVALSYTDLPPAAQFSALQAAGLNVQPHDVMQLNAEQHLGVPAPSADGPENHPLVKLMASLNIKFTDLDPTAQQAVLETLGLPSDGMTPSAIDTHIKMGNAAMGADQQGHTQHMDLVNAATGLADKQNSADQSALSRQDSVNQSDRSHQLAVSGQEQANLGAINGSK